MGDHRTGGWWRRFWAALTGRSKRQRAPGRGGARGSEEIRGSGGALVGGLGYAVAHLIEALNHADPDVRAAAAHELGTWHEKADVAPTAVAALIGLLGDEDASVRSAAALSLGEWGTHAIGAIPPLIALLAEEDDDVCSSAGIALEDIGEAARGPLQEALSHPDERVRSEAAAILQLMG